MSEPTDLAQSLNALLARGKPERLIAVGDLAQQLLSPYAGTSGASLARLDPDIALPAPALPPAEIALVAGALESLSIAQGSVLLGRLRDLYARRIWVVLQAGKPGLRHGDLMGHGFSRAGRYSLENRPVALYEFDIGTYKTTPDWLSSKHWANPRLFDKYRW